MCVWLAVLEAHRWAQHFAQDDCVFESSRIAKLRANKAAAPRRARGSAASLRRGRLGTLCAGPDSLCLEAGFGESALLGREAPLLLGECRVEVGPRSRTTGHIWASGGALRLGSGGARRLGTRGGGRAPRRMDDGAALALGNFALDLFADLAGPLGPLASRTFFVVKLGLGLPALPLRFVFASSFLMLARAQPVGKARCHSDDELEVVENPVHRRKGERGRGITREAEQPAATA